MEARESQIHRASGLLADGVDDFSDLIRAYTRQVRFVAHATEFDDIDRFFDWLRIQNHVSREQQDLIVCMQSRHTVRYVALKKNLAHIRFQDMLANSIDLPTTLDSASQVMVHLNPIYVWATYETRILLTEDTAVPAKILFYAVGDETRTTVIDGEGEWLLRRLERGSLSLRSLLNDGRRRNIAGLKDRIAQLVELGIVALC